MPIKLLTVCLLAAFVWGVITSANVGRVDRFQKPKTKHSVRQVKVLSVDATHRRIKHAFGESDVPLAPDESLAFPRPLPIAFWRWECDQCSPPPPGMTKVPFPISPTAFKA